MLMNTVINEECSDYVTHQENVRFGYFLQSSAKGCNKISRQLLDKSHSISEEDVRVLESRHANSKKTKTRVMET